MTGHAIAIVVLTTAPLVYQSTTIPHRVWKSVRARQVWHEEGRLVSPTLKLRLSPQGRAQVIFTIEPKRQVIAEAKRFTAFSAAGGLRVASSGTASHLGGRHADWIAIWTRPGQEAGYWAAFQTSEVTWQDVERPPAIDGAASGSAAVRDLGRAADSWLALDTAESNRVRLSFAIVPDNRMTVTAPAFAIESGGDGLWLVTGGASILETPQGRREAARIDVWLSPAGGIGYQVSDVRGGTKVRLQAEKVDVLGQSRGVISGRALTGEAIHAARHQAGRSAEPAGCSRERTLIRPGVSGRRAAADDMHDTIIHAGWQSPATWGAASSVLQVDLRGRRGVQGKAAGAPRVQADGSQRDDQQTPPCRIRTRRKGSTAERKPLFRVTPDRRREAGWTTERRVPTGLTC